MSIKPIQSLGGIFAGVAIAAAVAWAVGTGGVDAFGVPLFALCAAVAFAINWIAFVPAWLAQTEHYYDLVGSLTYLSLIACAVLLGGPDARGWIVAGMAGVWALRLGSFLFLRIKRAGGDRRFDDLKQDFGQFLLAWTLQALWVVLTLACALAVLTSSTSEPLGVWAIAGALVWLAGFAIEVVADNQKKAFRGDPANEGEFISTGLWAWSRHPNYFGEIVLWTGVALIALPVLSGWQYVALVSPVFVYLLLTRISGIPPLERGAEERWGDDPDYRAYVERTPVLWLRPPSSG